MARFRPARESLCSRMGVSSLIPGSFREHTVGERPHAPDHHAECIADVGLVVGVLHGSPPAGPFHAEPINDRGDRLHRKEYAESIEPPCCGRAGSRFTVSPFLGFPAEGRAGDQDAYNRSTSQVVRRTGSGRVQRVEPCCVLQLRLGRRG